MTIAGTCGCTFSLTSQRLFRRSSAGDHFAEKESGHKLKAVKSDHGSEFTSHGFVDFCVDSGIRRELANVGTPSESGVVERKSRTVVEMAWTMLEH